MHKSVLLLECIENLKLSEDSVVVDCTLGYAGHSGEILRRIPKGFLYAFDQDMEAIESSRKKLSKIASNYEIIYSNFSNLQKELQKRNVEKVDAILFDLGVSSPQLDEDYRGFSFHNDAALDMRMDTNSVLTAYDVVNTYSLKDLCHIFTVYGEEKYALSIAKHIVKERETKPISTTLELVEVIKESVPMQYKLTKHPARKVFQAIRIEVNHELEVFETALWQALATVCVKGRVCVITFHSLEDRICKQVFKKVSMIDKNLSHMPIVPENLLPKFKVIGTFEPSVEELMENRRSRSARLRVIERVKEG